MPGTTTTINLPQKTINELNAYCGKYSPRKKKVVLARMIHWFMAQPESVRQVVTDDFPSDLSDAYAKVLEHILAEMKKKKKR